MPFSNATMLLLSLLLLLPHEGSAELKLPTFLSDHMVLQREPMKSRLWGWADTAGANITASLNGVKVAFALADDDGKWLIELPPQSAGMNHVIELSDSSDDDSVVLNDIAFGDVFLCSGQSNMEMSMNAAFNGTAEVEDSINYPGIRVANVKLTVADSPQEDVDSKADYVWARSSPEAISNGEFFGWPSATCYYFGREVYKQLNREVPIGLLTSCWGGQKVECFSSPDALNDDTCGGIRSKARAFVANNDESTSVLSQFNDDEFLRGRLDDGPQATQLWNAMIHPLIQMRFAAALWYQGESNADDPESYSCRFPAMIADWRVKFGLPEMPFYYVQLAAFPLQDYSKIRAAQDAALLLPKVGVAVAIDVGDPTGPAGPIHPRRKQEVGRRLALNALAIQYEKDCVYSGPTVNAIQLTKQGAVLGLEPSTSQGLHFEGTAGCSECCYVSPFEVLGKQSRGNWTRATATIKDGEIHLESKEEEIFGIRFGWEGFPQCALYNGVGGPDDHGGIAAKPFEWCLHPSGIPSWGDGEACASAAEPLGDAGGMEVTIQ